MISGQTVVFISSIEWDFLWQGHQEIATRFAESGNTVLYIENLGVRSPGFRDRKRIAQRLKSLCLAWPRGGITQVDRNLYVCPPLVMPPFGSWLIFSNYAHNGTHLGIVRAACKRASI